ncbi:MAG: hypothetical protein P8L44_19585 [Opitutales bacterium]|nr:hypothetical protein [Opitutales bacterium]
MSEEELTRPPDNQDLVFLAKELNRLEVKYIVIGGLAINRLGYVRATDDVDLLISKDLANKEKVKKALEKLPDQAIKELGDEDLASWIVVRVNDIITVDLMTEASGINFQEAEKDIDWVETVLEDHCLSVFIQILMEIVLQILLVVRLISLVAPQPLEKQIYLLFLVLPQSILGFTVGMQETLVGGEDLVDKVELM